MDYLSLIFLFSGLLIGFFSGMTYFRVSKMKALNKAREDYNKLALEKSIVEERTNTIRQEKENLAALHSDEREKNITLEKQISSTEAEMHSLKEKIDFQKEEMIKLNEKFKVEFENIANKILKKNTEDFSNENQKSIGQLVNPLKEKIEKFEDTIARNYEKGLKDQTDLKAEIKSLHVLNKKISEDANNLTRALKSDTKKQGNWGELILEKVLERSGLVKGQEYIVQYTDRTDDGTLIRPDVIVNLPENKHVIIDSKVSLLSYNEYVNEDLHDGKSSFLKLHVDSVKDHVRALSEKNYQGAKRLDAPDFVLMFMPLESAFSAAMQYDPQLFNFAWDKKIVVVSPTTLLATLKTIEAIWKHEKQTQNAIEIARQGGGLYDKFVGFLTDLEKLGNQLNTAQKTYQDTYKKLSDGSGNIIGRIERLRKLGAKTSKQIPGHLTDGEDE